MKKRLSALILIILVITGIQNALLLRNIFTDAIGTNYKDIYSLGIYIAFLLVLGSISTQNHWRLGCVFVACNEIVIYLSRLAYLKAGNRIAAILTFCAIFFLIISAANFLKSLRAENFDLYLKYKGTGKSANALPSIILVVLIFIIFFLYSLYSK